MKKYWTIAKLGFQQDLTYRVNLLSFFLRQTTQFLIQVLFWAMIFKQKSGGIIFGYDFIQMIQYFFAIEVANLFLVTDIDFTLAEAIKSGDLSGTVMRPMSTFWAYFAKTVGKKFWWVIYLAMILAGASLLGVIHFPLTVWLWLPVVAVNAFLILFLYRFLLGMLAFWATNVESVLRLIRQPTQFLGGGWFPLGFLPGWLGQGLKLLPFYLLFGFPAELFQGRLTNWVIFGNVLKQFVWLALLFFLVAWIWSRGVRQYEAVGN